MAGGGGGAAPLATQKAQPPHLSCWLMHERDALHQPWHSGPSLPARLAGRAAASAAGVSTSVAVGIGVAVFAGLVGVLAATLLCVNAQKRRRQGAVPPEVQVGGG